MDPEILGSDFTKNFDESSHSLMKNLDSARKLPGVNGIHQEAISETTVFKDHSDNEMQLMLKRRIIICLLLWYFFSVPTLFFNKYILAYAHGDPTIIGSTQLLFCFICGYVQLKCPCRMFKAVKWERSPPKFFRNMLLVGTLRFSTLFLGLVTLWFVPVSFAETVKSCAPVFTVLMSWFLVGEKTSWLVGISLIPVMCGLALCSANELSFNAAGFAAAMATNLSECLQNVCSKKLLSGEKYNYSPPELQFYTSLASFCVQIPALILMVDFDKFHASLTKEMLLLLVINGISFHCQSIAEYALLEYISPVTHSVANTVKRALMIWISVIVFRNPVSFLSGLGTVIVIIAVLGYNKAREIAPPIIIPVKDQKGIGTFVNKHGELQKVCKDYW